MQDLDLKTLRLLVAVCDVGSIKDAAAQEHIEPSAISKRLSQLEAVLGVDLMVRARRGVELTSAGRSVMEHARAMLHTSDRLWRDVTAFKGGIQGQVRLAASSSAIAESLLDDLTQFMRDPLHQDIRVDIEERLSKDIVAMVKGGLASLGVCWRSVDLGDLQHQTYRQDELILAVHPEHALAQESAVYFEDTLDYEHVCMPPATAVSTMLNKVAQKAGRTLNYRAVVSNFDGAFRVVGANLGVSVVPREVANFHQSLGRIKAVGLLNDWAHREFVICYRHEADLAPAAAKLLHFLRAQAATSPGHEAASQPPTGRLPHQSKGKKRGG